MRTLLQPWINSAASWERSPCQRRRPAMKRCSRGRAASESWSGLGSRAPGSDGAGLARWLHGQGVEVVEVERPERQNRRRRGNPTRLMPKQLHGRSRLGRRPPSPRPGWPDRDAAQPAGRSSISAQGTSPRPPISSTPWSSLPRTAGAPTHKSCPRSPVNWVSTRGVRRLSAWP